VIREPGDLPSDHAYLVKPSGVTGEKLTMKTHQNQTTTADQAFAADRTRVLAAALSAALFGAFLFIGIGFAQSATVHNATHDARHAFALPCH